MPGKAGKASAETRGPHGHRLVGSTNCRPGPSISEDCREVRPGVGQPAPLTRNPTVRDVADVETIDSGRPPDDMHQISIADAIQQHRPAFVVFASPAFCTSRTCGPEIKVVQGLEPSYRDRLAFIHVEIYRDYKPDPSKKQLAQAVVDWRLQTEPWVFLIDSRGVIQSRFEGATASDELKTAIDQLQTQLAQMGVQTQTVAAAPAPAPKKVAPALAANSAQIVSYGWGLL